ncbi:hypothetical protein HYFRA_00006121 [Hymenoscyphus fraxineus]|uniref:Cytochrome P450 alkane hydroxylase n=1 Tax=Hymenoscyphus fraxineus TaxID=746836 RepID=A0A9N9LDQ5_9HELO|nr:hypothetical protein HYFRA_00006121 [Hymenoscyphus fraxineus]
MLSFFTPNLTLLILPIFIALFLTYRLKTGHSSKALQDGIHQSCKPPPKYPHLEHVIGIDLMYKTFRLMTQKRAITALAERHKKYGLTFEIVSVGQRVLHTMHPENFKAVYGSNWEDWGVEPARLKAMEPFCGRGFITTDGEIWKYVRRIMKPAFSETDAVDLDSLGVAVGECLSELPADGKMVDFAPIFYDLCLDMAGRFLLGQRLSEILKDQNAPPPVDSKTFLAALHASQSWVLLRVVFGALAQYFPNPKWKRDCRTLHSFVDHYVDRALAEEEKLQGLKPITQTNSKIYLPSFSLVRSLAKQTSSRYEIRSQVIQSILAMQDTTSTLLSNTIFLLSRNPTIWASLREEVLGQNGQLTAKELKKMTLLQNILKESLRIYPVFATSGRTALRDTVLPTGGGPDGKSPIFVRSNDRIITCFYGLHRDASVFGPDVEVFNPDRWKSISPGAWEYLPFSNGPRGCPGQNKALVEASFIVAQLAIRFIRIESRDDQDWAGDWKLVLKNFNGCKVAMYPV